jgi:uncharacterized oligopeptide transporter (OPT) family protein
MDSLGRRHRSGVDVSLELRIPFFVGGVIGWMIERKRPAFAELYNYPVASGIIAGGSLMGVVLIFWENLPIVLHQYFANH